MVNTFRWLQTLALAVLVFVCGGVQAQPEWRIASLEWPPYSGKNLPEGGAGIAVLRAALAAENIRLIVEFYPWSRALRNAKNELYAGVYPAWPEDVLPGFTKSPVVFRSPVGFVESRTHPLVWTRLEDLAGKKIGVVQDYGNTLEFMRLVANNTIAVEVVVDDLTNIRKVAARRIDAAFIDLYNLSYYLKHDAKAIADKVQANARVIGAKDLLLSMNDKFPDKNAHATLARGLSKIDSNKIIKDYLIRYYND